MAVVVRLDYDRIAHLYDERLRDHDVDPDLAAFIDARGGESSPVCILDVGCGTGKQLAADRARWPSISLVGVDRSRRMLEIARNRCRKIAWIRADGSALPLRSETIDYATSQFSYQHIGKTDTLLVELSRVLRPGGRFVMTNIDPWSMPGWLVYRCFPETRALDERDFLPVDRFTALLGDAGFRNVGVRSTDLSLEQDLRDFHAWAAGRHRASQLMAIPDDAYEAGMRRLEEAIRGSGAEGMTARSEFVRVTIAATKPDVGRNEG
jgi:SAM-dependent methyltransferase